MVIDDRLLSKQYISNRIEAKISDDALDASWDGDTTSAPSKNAVYDYVSSLSATSDMWGAESAASTSKGRARKSGNFGIGNASSFSFDDITHKLTVDGDLRVGAIDGSNNDIYLDDGAILYKYDSGSSAAMLTLNSSTGHIIHQNLAIGSVTPSVPLEINNAENDALTTADGTGLFQIGNDSGANIGMNTTKIQARSGGSASKLNLNIGGGDVDLGSASSTITSKGNMVVEGNLTVSGTATSINTETVTVYDNILALNSNYSGTSPTEHAGIEVNRGGGSQINTAIRWNETDNDWELSEATSGSAAYHNIIHAGQTGSVSNTMLAGSIANSKLTNDSVTVGSTEIDLGATATTIAGMTKMTLLNSGDNCLTITGGNSAASNAAVSITGHLEATTKSFNIPHPLLVNKRLVYGSLEGPEHGMYARGSFEIEDERRVVAVDLPNYWPVMVYNDYTINLTAYGDYNVWISNRDENGFWVETNAEGEWTFDWNVIGGRKDAKLEVEPDA